MALLGLMLVIPLVAAALAYIFGRRAFLISVAGTLLVLLLASYAVLNFGTNVKSYQFVETYQWLPSLGSSVILGVDGLGIAMVVLTAILFFVAVLVSSHLVHQNLRLYYAVFAVLEALLLGVFMSVDLLVFYIFWDLVVVAMFFLILAWGGSNRRYAAMKFIIYTGFASFVLLLSILAVYLQSGLSTFDMRELAAAVYPQTFAMVVFAAFFLAFVIKMPVFPFHTWLPDAHVEAPTPVSIILAGILLKMGAYGLIRLPYTMFPQVASSLFMYIAAFAVVSIVYGAIVAIMQRDLKRMVAFSSVMHMGLVLLGISTMTQAGFNGAIYEMFSHGLVAALGFSIAGFVHEKLGTRTIGEFSGIFRLVPRIAWILVFASLAAFGLPSTTGFPSEILIFIGSFLSYGALTVFAIGGGVVLATGMIWMLQKTCFGEVSVSGMPKDLNYSEYLPFAILIVLILFFGLYPQFLIDMIKSFPAGLGFVR